MGNIRNAVSAAALAALVAAGAAPAFAGTNLVSNGSFEDVSGNASPSFFLSDNAGDLTDWITSSNADFEQHPLCFAIRYRDPPRHGSVRSLGERERDDQSRWGELVAFDGDPTPGARQTMSQTISGLTVGGTYTLTFSWGATQYQFINGSSFNCSGCWIGATTNEMVVSLGGETQDTATVNVASKGFTGWMPESMTFTATSASEMLVFLSEGGPTSLPPVALLDGVSLTGDVPGAAPEPGTWAMMGIGFAGLGFAAYRRRRKALAVG